MISWQCFQLFRSKRLSSLKQLPEIKDGDKMKAMVVANDEIEGMVVVCEYEWEQFIAGSE